MNKKIKTPDNVTLGLIQMSCSPDVDANLKKAVARCEVAAKKGAQIICLPELFRSQYFCQQTGNVEAFKLAEPIPGPSTHALSKVAKKHSVAIVVPLFEQAAPGLYYNSAVVIDADGSILGKYRKMHIPEDPGFHEKHYFPQGDLGFKTFDTKFGRIGVLICWDQWYPEAARITALMGAKIIFYPTTIGWAWMDKDPKIRKTQHDAWETVQRGHAIANEVYVAAVNRVGVENKIKFWGASFVSHPFGEKLAVASHDKEEILIVKCDMKKIECLRQIWPFYRDRRIDAYEQILKKHIDS